MLDKTLQKWKDQRGKIAITFFNGSQKDGLIKAFDANTLLFEDGSLIYRHAILRITPLRSSKREQGKGPLAEEIAKWLRSQNCDDGHNPKR